MAANTNVTPLFESPDGPAETWFALARLFATSGHNDESRLARATWRELGLFGKTKGAANCQLFDHGTTHDLPEIPSKN